MKTQLYYSIKHTPEFLYIHSARRFQYQVCVSLVIVCSAVGRSEVEITCVGVEPSVLLQCSFSGGPLHPCEIALLTLDHTYVQCVNCVLIVCMVSAWCLLQANEKPAQW